MIRSLVYCFFTICFLCFIISSGSTEETPGTPVSDNSAGIFSHLGPDAFIVASTTNWYLEEYDTLGRPVTGTLWKDNSIAEQTSWLYDDETQQVRTKIVTSSTGSIEIEYDRFGNIAVTLSMNLKGETVKKTTNEYNKKNMLVKSITEEDKNVLLTQIDYDGDEISEKRIYKNDAPLITYSYRDSDNWSETIFKDGKPALVVEYENGERKKVKENEQ